VVKSTSSLASSLLLSLGNPTQTANGATTIANSQASDPINISTFSLTSNLILGSLATPTIKVR
jgi:hypothetical protein